MKILTILLGLLIVSSVIAISYQYERNNLELGNVEISSKNLETLSDQMPEGQYVLCSLKKEDGDAPCVTMFKRNLDG